MRHNRQKQSHHNRRNSEYYSEIRLDDYEYSGYNMDNHAPPSISPHSISCPSLRRFHCHKLIFLVVLTVVIYSVQEEYRFILPSFVVTPIGEQEQPSDSRLLNNSAGKDTNEDAVARKIERLPFPTYMEKHLADVESIPISSSKLQSESKIIPLYWHIPKSGGTAIYNWYTSCWILIEASEVGAPYANEETLRQIEVNGGTNHLNVDMSTVEGIKHASQINLIPSQIPQIIFAPLLHESIDNLFTSQNQAQAFAIFRHPIDRIVSLFYYLQEAKWEPTYNPIFAEMTLEEYANSKYVESNFIVRSLVNKMEGPLGMEYYHLAKDLLQQKFVVGLIDRWDESMERFDLLFQHDASNNDEDDESMTKCKQNVLENGSNRHSHPTLDTEEEAYKILARKNSYDMDLYHFIQGLFEEQGTTIFAQDDVKVEKR